MTPKSRSFRRRPNAGIIILRWAGYSFLLLGVVALGYCVWVQADTFAFQTYQSWRLDQMQQGKPASVALFVKQWIPGPWGTDATESAPTAPVAAAANSTASDGSASASSVSDGSPPSSRTGRSTPSAPAAGPSVHEGALIGRLQIPRLGLSAIVLEGVTAR